MSPASIALIIVALFGTPLAYATTQKDPPDSQQQQLMQAIIAEDVEAAQTILADGTGADFLIENTSPLIRAASLGHEALTSLLLSHGASPDFTNTDNASPLMNAAYYGHDQIVELLLVAGANVRIEHNNGFEAFDFALEKPHIQILLQLIRVLGRGDEGKTHAVIEYAISDTAELPSIVGHKESATNAMAPMSTVVTGELNKLQKLLELGVSPNHHNVTGYAALPLAARFDRRDFLEVLLRAGADINLGNNGEDEASAVNQAARSGNAELLEWLLARGASVNKANARGYTALHLATYRQCARCIQVLLQHGAKTDMPTDQGDTASSVAKQLGDPAILQLFEQHRSRQQIANDLAARIKAKALTHKDLENLSRAQWETYPTDGRPLLSHVTLHQPGLLKAILEKGVNANQPESQGLLATPLMYAVSSNNLPAVKLLIEHGANVNQADGLGNPAIDWAAYYGNIDSIAMLLAKGAAIGFTSPHGDAIDIAIRRGHPAAALLIARHQGIDWSSPTAQTLFSLVETKNFSGLAAQPNANLDEHRDPIGNSLLHHAVRHNCLACVEILLKKGMAVDSINRTGITPLMLASQRGSLHMLKLLVTEGGQVNTQALERGMRITPLMLASIQGHDKTVSFLVQAGAEIDARDTTGNTAALWALGEEQQHIAKLLLELGSDPNLENDYGYSVNGLSN